MMQDTAAPLLEVRNLSVSVGTDEGEARILDRANLALMSGSIHGVVGESGCGKSTLMRAILGILPKRGRATAGIATQLTNLKKAARKLTGYPLAHAFYGQNVLDYLLANNKVKEMMKFNPAANARTLAGDMPSGMFGL